jgi:hypothetical protein
MDGSSLCHVDLVYIYIYDIKPCLFFFVIYLQDKMPSFYSLDEAKSCQIEGKRPFIIAEERKRANGTIGRYFTVFESFKEFLSERNDHPHCHELIADHNKCIPIDSGRLVFDLDREEKYNGINYVPPQFQKEFETLILSTINKYYTGVDIGKIEFIWMTSPNKKKYSRHLVLKNFHFKKWLPMARDFYRLLEKEWCFDWCELKELVDVQIIRKSGSLRMAGSSKIGGSVLKIDKPEYDIEDTLIRIYRKSVRQIEQTIHPDQLTYEFPQKIKKSGPKYITSPELPVGNYELAYRAVETLYPGIFQPGPMKGAYMTLTRIKESICPFSQRKHEKIDSFIELIPGPIISIRFGCYRKCASRYSHQIGVIKQDKLIMNIYKQKNIQRK